MSNNIKVYQWATAILAVIVIFPAISLMQANKEAESSDSLDSVASRLEACNDSITAWRQANPDGQPRSADAQEELAKILSECAELTQ